MKKKIIGCILMLTFALIGCLFGYVLTFADKDPDDTWISLGTPPGKATRLLAANSSTIYVQSGNGMIYSCYRESKYDLSCWNPVEVIPEDYLEPSTPYPLQPPIPPVLEDIRESLAVRYSMDTPVYEGDHIFAYILLGDGTVKQWVSETIGWIPPHNQFVVFLEKTVGGLCVGSLIYPFVIFVIPMLRRDHERTSGQ